MMTIKRRLRPVGIAFFLGAASVAAFQPVGCFPLIFLTLGGFSGLLEKAADRQRGFGAGAKLGFAFGLGFFLSGVSWVYVSLNVFGNMPVPLAALSTVLFCAVESVFPAVSCALFTRFAPCSGSGGRRGLFFAALWTLTEWLRGTGVFGFPWLSIGYSQTPPSPLASFAPLTGVYGITLIVVFAAATLRTGGEWFLERFFGASRANPAGTAVLPARGKDARVSLLILAGLLAAGWGLRSVGWTSPSGEPILVSILQGNIPQEIKWRPEHFYETLDVYHRLIRENPAQLTILPETAFPAFLDQLPPAFIDRLFALAERQEGHLILGVATRDAGTRRYANSAVLLGKNETPFPRYDKSHLVPFGEFVPAGFRWFLEWTDIPMSDFTEGAAKQPLMGVGKTAVAVNICYEDAFGAEIARFLPEATLLVNLSNVAWFGDSLAPAQHLQIAQMRALETGRVLLRATNTGMTAIIGPDGRVQKRLPPFTRAALNGRAQAYVGATPFVRWGNGFVLVLAAALLVGAARPARPSMPGQGVRAE